MSFLVLLLTAPAGLIFINAWTRVFLIKLLLIMGLNGIVMVFLFGEGKVFPMGVFLGEGGMVWVMVLWLLLGGGLLGALVFKRALYSCLFLTLLVPANLIRDTSIRNVFLWASSIWPERRTGWVLFIILLIISRALNLTSGQRPKIFLFFRGIVVFVVLILFSGTELPIGEGVEGGAGGYSNNDPNIILWWVKGTNAGDPSVTGVMFLPRNAVTDGIPLGAQWFTFIGVGEARWMGFDMGHGVHFQIPLTFAPIPDATYEAMVVSTAAWHAVEFSRAPYFNLFPI